MVELNLDEMVKKIEGDTGMKSESCQPDSDGIASTTSAAREGKVFDKNTVVGQMPDLIEVTEPLELQSQ